MYTKESQENLFPYYTTGRGIQIKMGKWNIPLLLQYITAGSAVIGWITVILMF